MIKVVIIDNKTVIESVYPNPSDSLRIAWAQEGEKNSGYAAFTEEGELLCVVDKDNVFELLIRASLNHLDLNGVKIAYTTNEAMFAELFMLGFKRSGERLEIDIAEFFKPCGGCRG